MKQGSQLRAFRLQQVLLEIEESNLVSSFCPRNFEDEVRRVGEAMARGNWELPRFVYFEDGNRQRRFDKTRATLGAVEVALGDSDFQSELGSELAQLLVERVRELTLDAQAIKQLGSRHVISLGRERFRFSSGELGRARDVARRWSRLESEPESESDWGLLVARISRLRDEDQPAARRIVVVERPLASQCAVGGETLFVRSGARGSWHEARRLWVHEGRGHLLPRLAASHEPVPFGIGTPGCSADEEGRALLLEEREGCLSVRRRREIARRFCLADGLRESGVDGLRDAARDWLAGGDDPMLLARAVGRVLRAGGWGREVVYLPAYLRVKSAFEKDPGAESFFERGRASLQALDFFRSLQLEGPSNSTTTGA